jgi:Lar family restriction alleviation protein
MSEKLLPCPFCGGGAFVHRCEHAFHDAKIRCAGCQAEGPIFDVDDGEANEAGRNEAEAIAAWNRRTPAPEGEAVKSYGQKGRALYEAFWARNGDASPPPWDEQAHAIRAMWVNIARDAEPLYASPVVPVGVREAVLKAAQSIHNAAIIYEDEALLEDAEIVIAALRPTDTGRE